MLPSWIQLVEYVVQTHVYHRHRQKRSFIKHAQSNYSPTINIRYICLVRLVRTYGTRVHSALTSHRKITELAGIFSSSLPIVVMYFNFTTPSDHIIIVKLDLVVDMWVKVYCPSDSNWWRNGWSTASFIGDAVKSSSRHNIMPFDTNRSSIHSQLDIPAMTYIHINAWVKEDLPSNLYWWRNDWKSDTLLAHRLNSFCRHIIGLNATIWSWIFMEPTRFG